MAVGQDRSALAPPEKSHVLRDCGARVLLASPDAARQIAPLRADLTALDRSVRFDPGGDAGSSKFTASAKKLPILLPS